MFDTYSGYKGSELTYDKVMVMMESMRAMSQSAPPPLKIITNPSLTEPFQTFVPRSTKKRAIKKCKKKYTINIPSKSGYLIKNENTFICHPAVKNNVLRKLEQNKLILINNNHMHRTSL